MKISVVICCYNSAQRLKPTLEALANQTKTCFDWEIVLVNNNSNDNTSEAATSFWNDINTSSTKLRIVDERNPGLSYARKKGVSVSKGEYVLFCDDDNWLNDSYVKTAFDIMESDSSVGSLCGKNVAVYELPPDDFILQHEEAFAVGYDDLESCFLDGRKTPWGAGMVLRKSFLDKLEAVNFKSLLSDRKGEEISSGGDTELCYLLKLCGFKLRYDTRLELKHYIPKERSNYAYLKKLYYGFGKANAVIDWYYKYGNKERLSQRHPSWVKVYFKHILSLNKKKPKTKNTKEVELSTLFELGYSSQLLKDWHSFKRKSKYVKSILKQINSQTQL